MDHPFLLASDGLSIPEKPEYLSHFKQKLVGGAFLYCLPSGLSGGFCSKFQLNGFQT